MDDQRAVQINAINDMRSNIVNTIGVLKEIKDIDPPAIQEVIIACRSLEDARMRLGVARTYIEGKDPLDNK